MKIEASLNKTKISWNNHSLTGSITLNLKNQPLDFTLKFIGVQDYNLYVANLKEDET